MYAKYGHYYPVDTITYFGSFPKKITTYIHAYSRQKHHLRPFLPTFWNWNVKTEPSLPYWVNNKDQNGDIVRNWDVLFNIKAYIKKYILPRFCLQNTYFNNQPISIAHKINHDLIIAWQCTCSKVLLPHNLQKNEKSIAMFCSVLLTLETDVRFPVSFPLHLLTRSCYTKR